MNIPESFVFQDEEAALAFLESILWPHGAECLHCGVVGTAYGIAANPAKRVTRFRFSRFVFVAVRCKKARRPWQQRR
jgi:hypothetical protein